MTLRSQPLLPVCFGLLQVFSSYGLATAQPDIGQIAETTDHIVTTHADGVYSIRHRRAIAMGTLCGNTTVVAGAREVLVVDSCGLPSLAKGDITLIRQWTDKPIRYLVNTHWHGDHTRGNITYADAFPGLAIIAHKETPPLLAGFMSGFTPRLIAAPDTVRRMLAEGKEEDGSPLSEERRAALLLDLPRAEVRAAEVKASSLRLPNLTFTEELAIDLGDREVQIKYLGRGNTSGDAVVFLPREKILVAGDLLVYPFPFLLGGFPSEWARTLQRMAELEPEWIVTGHGATLHGEAGLNYLKKVKQLLESVTAAVRIETFKWGNDAGNYQRVLKAVSSHSDLDVWRQRFAADDKNLRASFDQGLPGLIASAYREIWGS